MGVIKFLAVLFVIIIAFVLAGLCRFAIDAPWLIILIGFWLYPAVKYIAEYNDPKKDTNE